MSYREWLNELGTLIRKNTTNNRGWKKWADWREYFDNDASPEEALEDAGVIS